MLKSFIMIVSILTNDGDLQMRAFDVEVCPEVTPFHQSMEDLRKKGEFIQWSAICLNRNVATEEL